MKEIPKDIYDIVIVGGGPAACTAGIYSSRGRMNTMMTESMSIMGQATMTDMVENYPGFDQIGGFELVSSYKKQAEKFGLKSSFGTVSSIKKTEMDGLPVWEVEDENGIRKALSVIVATGAKPRKLGVPGEDEFLGKGVSYCATCDGAFFREKDIAVIGGGDTAVEEALYLTKFGKKVSIVHRRDRFRAAKLLQERIFANDKMDFVWKSVVDEIKGSDKVEKIVLENVDTGDKTELACDGVFIFVGWEPNTGFLKDTIDLDGHGCIVVDAAMRTSEDGIFAAGDCCNKVFHQIVTACGDGATAAYSAQQYVEELKGIAYK